MYLGKEISEHFNVLDKCLSDLGASDSSIEYAPHIRKKFDKVVGAINSLKTATGTINLIQNPSWYFESNE